MTLNDLRIVYEGLTDGILDSFELCEGSNICKAVEMIRKEIRIKELEQTLNQELGPKHKTKQDIDMQALNDEITGKS